MAYKIIEIEGIGESYARKLEEAGVKTTDDLLAMCATPRGRAKLADETGISSKLILKWTNHADLFRIKGVAGQFAELLEAAGVDTVRNSPTGFRPISSPNLSPSTRNMAYATASPP